MNRQLGGSNGLIAFWYPLIRTRATRFNISIHSRYQILFQHLIVCLCTGSLGIEHPPAAFRKPFQVPVYNFGQSPADPVSYNRLPDLPGNGKSKPCFCLITQDIHDKMTGVHRLSAVVHAEELGPFFQPEYLR